MKNIVRLFVNVLDHIGMLNLITMTFLLGLILVVDGFLLLFMSNMIGGIMAMALNLLASLFGAFIVGQSFRKYSKLTLQKIHTGVYPKQEFINLSVLFPSLISVTIPGYFSLVVGVILYINPIRNILGLLLHWKFKDDFKEVYNYRRAMEE